jgi:16S rRNA G1207 methylase RsmC
MSYFDRRKIDLKRDYNVVIGNPPIRFQQDGIDYDHWGYEIVKEEPKPKNTRKKKDDTGQ